MTLRRPLKGINILDSYEPSVYSPFQLNALAVTKAWLRPNQSTNDSKMNCSFDMAKSFATDWRDNDTLLTVFFSKNDRSVKASAIALVREFSEAGVSLESPLFTDKFSGEPAHAPFTLTLGFGPDVSFEYSDPREFPEGFKEQPEAAAFVCSLDIKTNDFVLMLGELREQPDKV
jgi:hypothetical protein